MMVASSRSEMDITPVFGTVIGGSNPSGSTFDTNIRLGADFVRLCPERACFARVRDSKRFSPIFEKLCFEKMGNLY